MNIFLLDDDPKICAQYHCDRHLVKMPMEYLAILKGFEHPLSRWAWEKQDNFNWLLTLCHHVCAEYHFRYGQIHWLNKEFIPMVCPMFIPQGSSTQPYIHEGPVEQQGLTVVDQYRYMYSHYKRDLCSWSFRLPPEWFVDETYENSQQYFLGPDDLYRRLYNERNRDKT